MQHLPTNLTGRTKYSVTYKTRANRFGRLKQSDMTALIENSLLSADVQSGHSEEDHLSAELMKFLLENCGSR